MSEEVVASLREQVDKLSIMVEGQQQAFIHVLNALNNLDDRTKSLEENLGIIKFALKGFINAQDNKQNNPTTQSN